MSIISRTVVSASSAASLRFTLPSRYRRTAYSGAERDQPTGGGRFAQVFALRNVSNGPEQRLRYPDTSDLAHGDPSREPPLPMVHIPNVPCLLPEMHQRPYTHESCLKSTSYGGP